MKFEDEFGIVYFVVFGVVALGTWLFMRRLTPEGKHHWYARVSLISMAILSPFFLAFPIISGRIPFLLIVVLALGFIGYVNVAVVRVCRSCGHIAHPDNLVTPAKFCPKCGAPLVASKVFHD